MSVFTKGLISWIFMLCLGLLVGWFSAKSQSPSVEVLADDQTGCEYLTSTSGGITPRIGTDYMQVGCRWTDEEGEIAPPAE